MRVLTIVLSCSLDQKITLLQALCVYLLYERHRGTASFWAPYIGSLPTSYTVAACWSEDELRLLPSELRAGAEEQTRAVRQSWHTAVACLQAAPLPRHATVYDAYLWAWATVNSRSVFLRSPTSTMQHFASSSANDDIALVPFLDLLNHTGNCVVSIASTVFI